MVGCIDAQSESDFGSFTGPAVGGPYAQDDSGASGGENTGATTGDMDAGGDSSGTAGGATAGSTTGGTTGSTGSTGGTTGSTGTTGATGSTGTNTGMPSAGALKFSVLTKSVGGKHAPRNIGAIWIETSAGKWVKTLGVWAGTRERYLTRYLSVNAARNRVDAVASATLKTHATHSVTWNATDADRKVVADGEYRIVMELTDKDGTGASHIIPFTKSATPVTMSPANQTNFTSMSLSYQ